MNEKLIHSFEGICPLKHYGVYGIKKSFNMPSFPCSDKTEHISLKKHLMYEHNLSNTAANKIVLDCMNRLSRNKKQTSNLVFHNAQELYSHSVHWHKGQCPFSYGFTNVYNLSELNHHIKNFYCGHRQQCLLLSHLRVSHNLNIKSAKIIVKSIMTVAIESKVKLSIEKDIQETILFQKDDIVTNSNSNVYNDDRRFRHYCPLSENGIMHGQSLFHIPCTKTSEKFLLFAHLQHYHQMTGELALSLIRAIRTETESTVINDLLQNSTSLQSSAEALKTNHLKNAQTPGDIDIVPYKCVCPYATDNYDENAHVLEVRLKKFKKYVKNTPCDRHCPVNLYRHLRNYHKVDLQQAKSITRQTMLYQTRVSHLSTQKHIEERSTSVKTEINLSRSANKRRTSTTEVPLDVQNGRSEGKNESIDFMLGNENPDEWDPSIIYDNESLFRLFDEETSCDNNGVESSNIL